MDERRNVGRMRVTRAAKIIVAAETPLVPCELLDLTASGARLSFAEAGAIPDNFELTLDQGRSRRPCRVVWRTGSDVGVAFERGTG